MPLYFSISGMVARRSELRRTAVWTAKKKKALSAGWMLINVKCLERENGMKYIWEV